MFIPPNRNEPTLPESAAGHAECPLDDAMGNSHPVSLVAKTKSQQHIGSGRGSESRITSRKLGSSISAPLRAGYLGPINSITIAGDGHPEGSAAQASSSSYADPSQEVEELLECLREFPLINGSIHEYYTISQAAVVPAPFIQRALAEIEVTYDVITAENLRQPLSEVAATIIENTRQPFEVPPECDGNRFHELFTGPCLRLEVLGLIYALAGRSISFGFPYHFSRSQDGTCSPAQISQKMLAASDLAIQVCKSLSPVNDLFLWLVHENLLLSKMLQGDSSSVTWHRLGELSTYIFELGLHREPGPDNETTSRPARFLLESRRRLFAGAYQLDKSFCSLLGRPPRIPWRYSNCRMPLDGSDEALGSEANLLEAQNLKVDGNGWSVTPVFQRASWIRLRFIISTYREEILELSLQRSTPERTRQLRDVSRRCAEAWESLPSHLHYKPSCWETKLPISVKLMLVISYLTYLHNEFLVQKLLVLDDNERDDGYVHLATGASPALISVSSAILTTVLALGKQQEHSVDIRRDFNWIILHYGFPSASVLVKALQLQAGQRITQPTAKNNTQSLPTPIPSPTLSNRSALLRDLSVFIFHLESMAQLDQSNRALLARAARSFARDLDDILEPSPGGGLSPALEVEDETHEEEGAVALRSEQLVRIHENEITDQGSSAGDYMTTLGLDLDFGLGSGLDDLAFLDTVDFTATQLPDQFLI
ncbi:hypothetical protein AbraIFM66951_001626 [Aspergillus brasiliensis]|uniref:Xylanolytic transcriptional activator regulatory domain-containing protein n=1 Tax=Aspergillus brasiliensis TaxID=319629 RepID=A0A9W5YNS1_9EURO|nr:hypothetical protein AbraCBS73388_005210 [Aspergillus brasiliensis]GKZ49222.1 hypothetical protein AbraIFM66951_001626 [Aspergillus brasiliensis]